MLTKILSHTNLQSANKERYTIDLTYGKPSTKPNGKSAKRFSGLTETSLPSSSSENSSPISEENGSLEEVLEVPTSSKKAVTPPSKKGSMIFPSKSSKKEQEPEKQKSSSLKNLEHEQGKEAITSIDNNSSNAVRERSGSRSLALLFNVDDADQFAEMILLSSRKERNSEFVLPNIRNERHTMSGKLTTPYNIHLIKDESSPELIQQQKSEFKRILSDIYTRCSPEKV